MAALSRKDGLCASLAVAAIILGVASGNGIAMFVICAIALAPMVVFTPRTQLRSGLLIALLGTVVGLCVLLAFLKIVPLDLLRSPENRANDHGLIEKAQRTKSAEPPAPANGEDTAAEPRC